MSLDTSDGRFLDCVRSFVTAYRTNSLAHEEMIVRRRENVKWFADLRFKRVYDLREDQIADILGRCEVSYYSDRTDRYDDPAVRIMGSNSHVRVASFLISMIRNRTFSMSDYELEIEGMDGAVRTELISMVAPDRYVPMDEFTLTLFQRLGMCDYSDSFMSYMRFQSAAAKIVSALQEAGILRADLSTATEFLYHMYQTFLYP